MVAKLNFTTPILLIAFNRPKTTEKVFNKLKELKPNKLFIAVDAPRKNNTSDKKKCKEVKDIVTNIDWVCDKKFLFHKKNHGCRLGVSSSIDWFFNNVNKGIILEDDCLPSISFFNYCSELLERYATEKKIFQINGVNWDLESNCKCDYFFTKYPAIWGWATWKDRWKLFDLEMKGLEEYINSKAFRNHIRSKRELRYHVNTFVNAIKLNSWDYSWKYTIFSNNGLCVTPRKNMITNLGFGIDSTHTKNGDSWKSNMKKYELSFPLKHPSVIKPNEEYEKKVIDKFSFKKRHKVRYYKRVIKYMLNECIK